MAMITVTTVPATTVEKGKIQITARARATTDKETKKKIEIPADQRSRSITIQELTPAVSSKYVSIVCSALYGAAKDQLDELWTQNAQIREVDDALFKEDALLAFAARQSESKKLTSDSIVAWWNQSELKKSLIASGKYSDKQLGALVEQLKNLAAPTPDYNEERALKRIVTLSTHESDVEHDVCAAMITKLNKIVEKIKQQRESIAEEAPADL